MDFHCLVVEKSWKINVGKEGAPCKYIVSKEAVLSELNFYLDTGFFFALAEFFTIRVLSRGTLSTAKAVDLY